MENLIPCKYSTLVVCGPDRVGKDTLISALKNHYNAELWQVLHYSKPPKLDTPEDYILYQSSLFHQMFGLMCVVPKLILNRSHIGESVYAHYRGYDGSYVFDIEDKWRDEETNANTAVIILISDANQLIKRDDGKSFYQKKEDAESEIGRFIVAYDATNFTNKILINVSNMTKAEVAAEVITFLS